MSQIDKIHVLIVLFIVLVLVLVVNPSIIKNMYSSFLGRIMLVFIVLFFAMNNMTLGLLTALVFIILSNMILATQEGVTTMDESSKEGEVKEVKEGEEEEVKEVKEVNNIDMETIKDSLKSLSSTMIPVPTQTTTTEDVLPALPPKEAFQSMYASF